MVRKNSPEIDKAYSVQETGLLNYQIREEGAKYEINLTERAFEFAVEVILLLKTVPRNGENDVVRYQLAKSATSIGANYEESQATNSRADFRHKIGIALKEARESNYWLRVMDRTEMGDKMKVAELITESIEIKSIFGAIYTKVQD